MNEQKSWLKKAARLAAELSGDAGTNNGAVIVARNGWACSGVGANLFYDKAWSDRATDRTAKLALIEHAERDAVYQAARKGYATNGATMYAVWAACPECARAIVGAGIVRLVTLQSTRDMTPERWLAPIQEADRMLEEAGVALELWKGRLGVEIMFDGKKVEV